MCNIEIIRQIIHDMLFEASEVRFFRCNQEAYTGEIIQDWRSFKATFEAVTSPRRKWAALAAVTTVLNYIASSFSSHDRDIYGNNWEKFWFI